MKVLITGASGFIGRHLTRDLVRNGHHVVALTRSDPSALATGAHITLRWNPHTGLGTVHRAPLEGLDAVVHLAGEPIAARRWTAAQKERIRASRVEGTRALVDGLASLGISPRTFVSASAVGIYGDRGDEELDEASPPGHGFLADVCRQWEAESRRAAELGARTVQLRIGLVLGRGGGALQRMLPPFRLGIGGPFGSGRQWVPWIHLDDVVGLIRFVLADRAPVEGPVNAAAPHPVRNRQFAEALGRAVGRPARLPVPALALRLVLGEMSQVLLHSQRVVPRAAMAAGFAFRYPELEPALQACMAPVRR